MKPTDPLPLRPEYELRDVATLRAIFGGTSDVIWGKSSPVLTYPMLRFIKLSPFYCLASYDAEGRTDISPRGDAPGSIECVGGHTLLLPDRPGNRRYDTLRNIFETGRLSLLFMIPGVLDTLRVNGRARVTRDPEIRSRFVVKGRMPEMALVVTVEEAYGHCSKAIRRSKLWTDTYAVDRAQAPSLAEMMAAHLDIGDREFDGLEYVIQMDATHNQY